MDFGAVAYDVEEARVAEALGFSFIGQGDYLATFTHLLELAQATTRAQFGSFIMTPYGRHPAVTAMECTRIQHVSGGRLVMSIGRGFRSAALMGRAPIPMAETRAYVDALRRLVRGEGATWEGNEIPPLQGVAPVRAFVSAYGPSVRRMAGSVGDGAVLATGSSIPQLEEFLADVVEGARSAGRDPSEVETWLLCRASVRPSRAEALDDVRGLLAASGYRHLQSAAQVATVPDELRDALAEYHRRYDPTGFEGYQPSWDGPNARLVQELGLEEFFASRFAIVGTPEECRAQVDAIAATGVTRIVFAPGARDGETLYQRIADALIA